MEEYLDKNKNGTVENQAVVDEMVKKKYIYRNVENEKDVGINPVSGWEGQSLGNDATHFLQMSTDYAALEEVLHLI